MSPGGVSKNVCWGRGGGGVSREVPLWCAPALPLFGCAPPAALGWGAPLSPFAVCAAVFLPPFLGGASLPYFLGEEGVCVCVLRRSPPFPVCAVTPPFPGLAFFFGRGGEGGGARPFLGVGPPFFSLARAHFLGRTPFFFGEGARLFFWEGRAPFFFRRCAPFLEQCARPFFLGDGARPFFWGGFGALLYVGGRTLHFWRRGRTLLFLGGAPSRAPFAGGVHPFFF